MKASIEPEACLVTEEDYAAAGARFFYPRQAFANPESLRFHSGSS
jgi:hypothetical protein